MTPLDVDPRYVPEEHEHLTGAVGPKLWTTNAYVDTRFHDGYWAGRAAVEAENLRHAKPVALLWLLTLIGAFALGWAVGR